VSTELKPYDLIRVTAIRGDRFAGQPGSTTVILRPAMSRSSWKRTSLATPTRSNAQTLRMATQSSLTPCSTLTAHWQANWS
jgi:hypothetical protein